MELLPAWFSERMMCDQWSFGLMLDTSFVLAIKTIDCVSVDHNGNIWLDVEMLESMEFTSLTRCGIEPDRFITSPTSRTEASVNACHVVAAFELCDT